MIEEEEDKPPPWPVEREYFENGKKITVYKRAYLEGFETDHVVKRRQPPKIED